MKTVVHGVSGKKFTLGRNEPSVNVPTLDFERYMRGPFAPARPLGQRWETKSIHLLHDPAGNDSYGDCTCAGIVKLDVAWNHNAGSMITPDMSGVSLGLYHAATGWLASDPSTDKGADLLQILRYVKQHGVYGNGTGKLISWCSVDATKLKHVVAAIDIFGGLYTGLSLPDAWLSNPEEGTVWDVNGHANPNNGHSVVFFDYNMTGVIINTWGMFIQVTWDAVAKYWGRSAGGEVYAVLGQDWLNKASHLSPSGFDFKQLQADVAAGY